MPVTPVELGLESHRDPEQILLSFRRHPSEPGTWLFKEGWWFGGVWQLHGKTSARGKEDFFSHSPLVIADAAAQVGWWSLPVLAFLALRRRAWLNRNGRRVPRSLWRKAAPLI
jgi:hypothetical protein